MIKLNGKTYRVYRTVIECGSDTQTVTLIDQDGIESVEYIIPNGDAEAELLKLPEFSGGVILAEQ